MTTSSGSRRDGLVQVITADGRPYAVIPLEALLELVRQGAGDESGDLDTMRLDREADVVAALQALDERARRALAEARTIDDQMQQQRDELGENAEDLAALDRVNARLASGEEELLPIELTDRMMAGESPIKVFREHRGMTQQQLASEAGTSRLYISQIESGRRAGSTKLLRRVANALQVDLDAIVT